MEARNDQRHNLTAMAPSTGMWLPIKIISPNDRANDQQLVVAMFHLFKYSGRINVLLI